MGLAGIVQSCAPRFGPGVSYGLSLATPKVGEDVWVGVLAAGASLRPDRFGDFSRPPGSVAALFGAALA